MRSVKLSNPFTSCWPCSRKRDKTAKTGAAGGGVLAGADAELASLNSRSSAQRGGVAATESPNHPPQRAPRSSTENDVPSRRSVAASLISDRGRRGTNTTSPFPQFILTGADLENNSQVFGSQVLDPESDLDASRELRRPDPSRRRLSESWSALAASVQRSRRPTGVSTAPSTHVSYVSRMSRSSARSDIEAAQVSFERGFPPHLETLVRETLDLLGKRFPVGCSQLRFGLSDDPGEHGQTVTDMTTGISHIRLNPRVYPAEAEAQASTAEGASVSGDSGTPPMTAKARKEHMRSSIVHESIVHALRDQQAIKRGVTRWQDLSSAEADHITMFSPSNLDENEYYQAMMDVYHGMAPDSDLERSTFSMMSERTAPAGSPQKLFLQFCCDDIAEHGMDFDEGSEEWRTAEDMLFDIDSSHDVQPRNDGAMERSLSSLARSQASLEGRAPTRSAMQTGAATPLEPVVEDVDDARPQTAEGVSSQDLSSRLRRLDT